MQIVIVDDEAIIVRGLSKLIARIGDPFQVTGIFTRSKDALEFLQSHTADVLITDIRMPEMDGLSLISQAKMAQKNLHCIILTGYNDFDYARSALKLGAVDYLLKPVDDRELHITLHGILSQASEPPTGYVRTDYSREVAYLKKEIEGNFAKFDLGTCADKLGKSREYLCRLYKKETGTNLPEYLKKVRMEHARQFLEQIDCYRVYEVCELVGFTDPVYFAKQFKIYTGMTPKDYQRYGMANAQSDTDKLSKEI